MRIYIPYDIGDGDKKPLIDAGHEVYAGTEGDVNTMIEEIKGADAVILRTARMPRELLEHENAKDLKIIARYGAGYDTVDPEAAEELGIWLTNTPLANAGAVSEYAMSAIMLCGRNLQNYSTALRAGDFGIRSRCMGHDLEGKTVGIVGFGKIGRMLAKKCVYGFDMKVIAYDPYVTESGFGDEVTLTKDIEEVFSQADFVSLHMPSTPETRGFANMSLFSKMKSSAYVINSARGDILVEEDLAEAVKTGMIAGAVSDVFSSEPPPADHPFFSVDGIVTTPHNAAMTVETFARIGEHAAKCLLEAADGKIPEWTVIKPKNPRLPLKEWSYR